MFILNYYIAIIFIILLTVDCGESGDIRNMTGRRTKLPCPKPDIEDYLYGIFYAKILVKICLKYPCQ